MRQGSIPRPTALWVVPVADLGGVARHVLDVVRSGIPGFRVIVACPEGQLVDELLRAGAAVTPLPIGPDAGLGRSVRELRGLIHALRPAVVHSHLAYADVVAAIACRGIDVATVSTEHGIAADPGLYHSSAVTSRGMAWVHGVRARGLDALVAVSEATAAAMRDRWRVRRPVAVIRNGVDRPAVPVRRGPGLRVLSLARLAPEKGLPTLLDAFALVLSEHRGARLTLAGSGPLASTLRDQARRLGIQDAVSMPGHVDAGTALAEADVLAQLSVWENCSYSLLDASARGLGVVATPVGGNPEILPTRCLVPPDPEQVARAIVRQGTRPETRPDLPVDWPDVAQMSSALARVYEGIL